MGASILHLLSTHNQKPCVAVEHSIITKCDTFKVICLCYGKCLVRNGGIIYELLIDNLVMKKFSGKHNFNFSLLT